MDLEGKKDFAGALAKYQASAEKGNVDAMANLAAYYHFGMNTVQIDLTKAMEWLKKAVTGNSRRAIYLLAYIHLITGDADVRTRNDPKAGIQLINGILQKEPNDPFGGFIMGYAYLLGRGVAPSAEHCNKHWSASVPQLMQIAGQGGVGSIDAAVLLMDYYESIPKSPEQIKTTFGFLTSLAEIGLVKAQTLLAQKYFQGLGVEKDEKQGIAWITKAAEQGHGPSIASLANIYREGRLVEKDEKKAAQLYEQAAERGRPPAYNSLGLMYMTGAGGLPTDATKAFECFQKAADYMPEAQYNLADCYYRGAGVEQNALLAAALYQASAESGFPLAVYMMGTLFETGMPDADIPRDAARARQAYERAAQFGVEPALRKLGITAAPGAQQGQAPQLQAQQQH